MEQALFDQDFPLQKIPGKGGWTYVYLPYIGTKPKSPFGWVRVKGTIDGFPIQKYHLMPSAGGKLFLPVRAAIRAKIKKEAGDLVRVTLYPDDVPPGVPPELLSCLQDEPEAFAFFDALDERERSKYITWIDAAKTDEIKVDRIATCLDLLANHRKFSKPR